MSKPSSFKQTGSRQHSVELVARWKDDPFRLHVLTLHPLFLIPHVDPKKVHANQNSHQQVGGTQSYTAGT